MKILKKIISKITPEKVKTFFANDVIHNLNQDQNFATLSYAQEGEDLILKRFLEYKDKGFYVDIGAHHPKRFSNTYLFYKKGWRGINIDAMPGSMDAFNKERPKDINLEVGVSKIQGELKFYMFNEPALNTFSATEANKKDGLRKYKIIQTKKIPTYSLKHIFDKYLDNSQNIDFLSIDVEGLDLDVLKSNDWALYRPQFVLVEDLRNYILVDFFANSDLYSYLHALNYELVAKTFNTLFFKDKEK
jgi:FkbM family methyltransferase